MDLGLRDKLAVVAGGSSGIGRAVSLALAEAGCRVVAVSRGHETGSWCAEHSGRIHAINADLTVTGAEHDIAAALVPFGVPDVLVNSVGNAQGGLFWELDDLVWQQAFALKVMGTVRLLRLIVPQMAALGRGRIVNIVGNNGRQPGARYLPGAAANAALLAITKGLADEVAAQGITINAINPGPTRTRRWAALLEAAARDSGRTIAEIEGKHLASIPAGRISEPEEIARYVLFLCSPLQSAATGTSITIDGGATRALA